MSRHTVTLDGERIDLDGNMVARNIRTGRNVWSEHFLDYGT